MSTAEEKHYTPQQVAEMWGVSSDTVRRLFHGEDGVLEVAIPRLLKPKKKRTSLRIPASVLCRVHEQWSRGSRGEIQPRRRRI
jgi:hypothetical protein